MNREFEDDLAAMRLVLVWPDGYEAIATKQNRDVRYGCALRNTEKEFELRYTLRPFADQVRQYQAWLDTPDVESKILTDPNGHFMIFFQSIVFNVTGNGSVAAIERVEMDDLKTSGADEMFMAVVLPSSTFGEDFKRCIIFAMFKKEMGMAFIFHLSRYVLPTASDFKVAMESLRFVGG